ncbi:MAG: hypothetical protein QOI38_132 [Sphingomonadales bacterium]|nr:hypothetical protein [Sphingomonadales bacterium]
MISATDTNTHDVSFTYDALGRVLSEGSSGYGAKTYRYDAAGRRTRMTWRDSFFVVYDYNVTGEMTQIRERNGSTDDPVTSGAGVLATFGYDSRGRRISLTRGNGAVTTYAYDNASRLSELVQNPDGTARDLSVTFAYNPSSQIVSSTRSNESFATLAPTTASATVNGRNQLTNTGGLTVSHDARGNIDALGSVGFTYTAENRLAGAPSPLFAYDGLGRLYYRGVSGMWWDYDGERLTAEIDAATNTILRRWVHGPGGDEPLVQYEASTPRAIAPASSMTATTGSAGGSSRRRAVRPSVAAHGGLCAPGAGAGPANGEGKRWNRRSRNCCTSPSSSARPRCWSGCWCSQVSSAGGNIRSGGTAGSPSSGATRRPRSTCSTSARKARSPAGPAAAIITGGGATRPRSR